MSNAKNSRRDFLKKSAAAGAGFFIVPRNVLGGPGFIAPSDQLRIAAFGAGGKGYGDLSRPLAPWLITLRQSSIMTTECF
jgi:hypothetical protein